ncbi:unnamed protein product [Euphydryas editha]|uniref:Uncharacterized protein n=1 Tax=Euphydryas editha TaxID=104508 RepID=A0AAU9UXU3_EUPED|nr:unnamed protein product [Euphydryas editha]
MAAVAYVVKSGDVVREKSVQSQSHRVVQGTHSINKNIDHDTSRPTLRSRPAPMQFTSPHPAPDWPNAARASERRPRAAACTVPRRAPLRALPQGPRPRTLPLPTPRALRAERSSYVR